ncbi:glycosyltransferase family 4 protein [Corynebacterium gottingense]|uniref:glycosyltransferase family 4 protein n=1 Tax=Corynebacterium gottingense TaxID=2041036 RepID=UPI0038D0A9A2
MKILIVSQYWYPENGVPQRRWSWLSNILTTAGHDVMVVAPPPHYQRKVTSREWLQALRTNSSPEVGPSGELILRSPYIPDSRSLTSRVLNQAFVAAGMITMAIRKSSGIQEFKPEIVIGTVPAIPTSVVAAIIGRVFDVPYMVDLRDAWPDLLDQAAGWNRSIGEKSIREKLLSNGPLQILTAITRKAIYRTLRNSQGILVTSAFLRSQLLRKKELEGGSFHITTIRNVFPPKTPIKRQHGGRSKKNSLNVLYAGTLGRAQNLANAIEAANMVASRGIHIHLRLIGAGAAREPLTRLVEHSKARISIENRRPADELGDCYEWADTALVHLTDWEPLARAVPSKTYELMEAGIHISGVVTGETAELISKLHAGDVVNPEAPEDLANLWCDLARDPSRLSVSSEGLDWVSSERTEVVPPSLLNAVSEAQHNKRKRGQ